MTRTGERSTLYERLKEAYTTLMPPLPGRSGYELTLRGQHAVIEALPSLIELVEVCLQHSTCPGCAANMTQDEGHDDGCPLAPFEEPSE